MKIDIDKVIIDNSVYPRDNFDNETVNSYVTNVDDLPPIILSKESVLIDGYHRLLATRLAKRTQINFKIIDCPHDQILWLATKLNSKHGLQLSEPEKRNLAEKFFKDGKTYQQIRTVLAVSLGELSIWLKDLNNTQKEKEENQIIDLYLQCKTQHEIADKVGLKQNRISQIINNFKSEKIDKIDLKPKSLQLFNVWNFGERDKRFGLDFKGAIPGQIIENVLYYYTQPFDLVIDPMGGGGTTNDVCKSMYRRCHSYDLKPLREDVQQHDICGGYPKEAKNCDCIILDPPYFNMVFTDLYKDINDFYAFQSKLARDTWKTLRKDGIVAYIIEDMTEKGNYCLSGEAYNAFTKAKFSCIDHISVPLSTQQFNPQQMEKAKQDVHLLGRNRDLYIFRKN